MINSKSFDLIIITGHLLLNYLNYFCIVQSLVVLFLNFLLQVQAIILIQGSYPNLILFCSIINPEWSVAISNKIPPGSLKYTERK